jgi:hypothetical protein
MAKYFAILSEQWKNYYKYFQILLGAQQHFSSFSAGCHKL